MDTTHRLRFAVIPTHSRPLDLLDCLAAIVPQVDEVFVISNRAAYTTDLILDRVTVVYCLDDPPNISRLWNIGLDAADTYARGAVFDVAVLNDDVVVPPGWFDGIQSHLREHDAVAGSAASVQAVVVHRRPGPVNLHHRMQGYAFMLDGSYGLRADEQFQWWFGDDDLEWRARQAGGVVLTPRFHVEHRHPNSTTVGVLADIAGQDRIRFKAKWGELPH